MSTLITSRTVVQDEGAFVPSNNVINFTGTGVSVSNVGGAATVVIPGNVPATNYGLFAQTGNSTPITNTTVETTPVSYTHLTLPTKRIV